ncbi:MAG: 3-hydroxyacyl-CoA dehydrogenase NAD-binding domain-containing protein [Lachnospiraceae bacterium]|nr:3-hydroxyacyl-CoA dehydrogenase NAD-binding domain-containing protein [Lachnospiraceae bacterium]
MRVKKSVFIGGASTMGSGIAQVFAGAGWSVTLFDISTDAAVKAIRGMEKTLSRLVEKGKISEDIKKSTLENVTVGQTLEDAVDCDLVLEAIVEKAEVKSGFFKSLDSICKPETIFATNTSSISITEIASAISRQDKFIGIHFFNPAPVMKLVEVIRGFSTSDETFEVVFEMVQNLGKEAIEVKEAPGFVVNKILIPMINEAIGVLEQGIATAEDIDKAMRFGAGHAMGPLATSDLVGNDIILDIMNTIHEETGDPKYRPCALLKKMVRAKKLGKKTGEGFFVY